MLRRFNPASRLSAARILVSLAVLATASWSGENDVIFTQPTEGAVLHVGDVVRIEFHLADTSVSICRDMMGFTNDDGLNWVFLSLFMNCTDTISQLGHFDWLIPEEVDDSRSPRVLPTVGTACRLSIQDYEPIRLRGQSATFTIAPASAQRNPVIFQILQPAQSPALGLSTVGTTQVHGIVPLRIFSIDGRAQVLPRQEISDRQGSGVVVLRPADADLP